MEFQEEFEKVLFTEAEIRDKVEELGMQISQDYQDQELLLVGVLRGCVIFIGDLMRQINIPLQLDFLSVASYGQSSVTSGVVRVLKDLNEDIENRHVLLVEDIVDSGLTLNYLQGHLKGRSPASLSTCVLLDKPYRREVSVEVDYIGFEVPDKFLVGYGLDYAQQFRHLPYIATLKKEAIEEE